MFSENNKNKGRSRLGEAWQLRKGVARASARGGEEDRPRGGCTPRFLLALILLALGGWSGPLYASNYVYDAAGRLVAVTAPNGSSAQYTYDSVGNLLGIQSVAAGQLALFTSSPGQGLTGSQVTIQGNGFSPTASNDTVEFNGVTATVVSATAHQLVVMVPANATSGPVTVAVGGITVTASTNFVIGQGPAITGFTPGIGDVGSAVTVSGSYLDPAPGSTAVTVGGQSVPVRSSSNTQLIFTVPSGVGSGPIEVTTPYGQATTTTDLIVPPAVIGATNVASSALLTANGPAQSLNVSTANQYGLFAVNATAGQWLSLQLTALTTGTSNSNVSYQVYSPANIEVAYGSVSVGSNMSIHLPSAPISGIYLIAFDSGSGSLQVSAMLETDGIVITGGPNLSTSINMAGQSQRLSFTATAGQTLAFGFSGVSTVPANTPVIVTVYRPDGTLLMNGLSVTGITGFNLPNLVAGTYTMTIIPENGATASLQVESVPGVTGTLTTTGGTTTFNTTAPGQYVYLTFSATVGQNLALALSNIVGATGNPYVTVMINTPTGTGLPVGGFCGPSVCAFDLSDLPQTGTYQVVIVPNTPNEVTMATMSVGVTLTADVTSTLSLNSPFNLDLAQPGQEGLVSFTATAGQTLAFGFSGVSTVPANTPVIVTVYRPDGTLLMNGLSVTGITGFNLPNLVAGTYTMTIIPENGATASLQVESVPGVTGTLTTTGGTANFNTTTPGQDVYLSFSGTAGQNLALALSNLVIPVGNTVSITIDKPDGATLTSVGCGPPECAVDLSALPQTGTYQVLMTPSGTFTMSFGTTLVLAGDLNGDGKVDNTDVLLAERMALGLMTPTSAQLAAGSVAPLVNGVPSLNQSTINSQDVLVIQRKALGLVNY